MYLCVQDMGFTSFYVCVCSGYRFYLFVCIHKYIERGKTDIINTQITESSKSNILNTQITVRSKTDILNKQIIERDKTDTLNTQVICLLRISVLPLSMYLCVEDISFTSFYVFVY
jgi:hypothetical protein